MFELTDLIIIIIDFVCGFGIKILPDLSDMTSVFSNAESVVGVIVDFIKQVNFIVPLPTIIAIVGIEISIHITIFVFWVGAKIAKTVVSLIP